MRYDDDRRPSIDPVLLAGRSSLDLPISGRDPSPCGGPCFAMGPGLIRFRIEYVPALHALQVFSVDVLRQRKVASLAARASLEPNHFPSSPSSPVSQVIWIDAHTTRSNLILMYFSALFRTPISGFPPVPAETRSEEPLRPERCRQ